MLRPDRTGNIIESPHPQRVVSSRNRIRPILRVTALQHRSEEDILMLEAIQEQPRPPQLCRRASHTSENHLVPALLHHSRNSPNSVQSPDYQAVIPAFHPNHYDPSGSTICLCIPIGIKTPLNRWRQRRRSAKELHDRDDELRTEYARLKQTETELRGDLPPYEEARMNGVPVTDEGFEQPRTGAVPDIGPNRVCVRSDC
jgi:hypothetical protein